MYMYAVSQFSSAQELRDVTVCHSRGIAIVDSINLQMDLFKLTALLFLFEAALLYAGAVKLTKQI